MALTERCAAAAPVLALSAALAAGPLALGCSTDRRPPGDSTVALASSASAAASATTPACPATGHWSPCQVKSRLDRSGVVPRDSALSDLPALGVRPLTYVVGTSGLAVYLFADATTRARAARMLDTGKYVASSAPLGTGRQATLIENDNLLALLFTQREQQRERVADALLAGAPQR